MSDTAQTKPIDHIIILAGGISSRMKRPEHSDNLPEALVREANEKSKALISIGRGHRPFLDYLLYNAQKAGFGQVLIVIGESDHSFKDYYGNRDRGNAFHGLEISYAVQTIPRGRAKPLGTADALQQALDQFQNWRERKFVVCNSDNLYSTRALSLLRNFEGAGAWIDYDRDSLEFNDERISGFAVTQKDDQMNLVKIIEKPAFTQIEAARDVNGTVGVSMNLWLLMGELIYPYLQKTKLHPVRQEEELPAAILQMSLENPGSMKAIPLKEHVPDLTSKQDILSVQKFLREQYGTIKWE